MNIISMFLKRILDSVIRSHFLAELRGDILFFVVVLLLVIYCFMVVALNIVEFVGASPAVCSREPLDTIFTVYYYDVCIRCHI